MSQFNSISTMLAMSQDPALHTLSFVHPSLTHLLARPNPHSPVLPPLNKIPILNPHCLDDTPLPLLLNRARPAVPMPSVSLVVHLDHILARGRDDAAVVEHHARDGVVVGVRVVDGACAEIPDL